MEDRTEDIIKQYPIHLNGKRRIRGAILLEAKEGLFTLVNFKEGPKRLQFQERVKQNLIASGYPYVDEGIANINGEMLTRDRMGNHWFLKRWFLGKECNLHEERDMIEAVRHLASLHNLLHDQEYIATQQQEDTQDLEAAQESVAQVRVLPQEKEIAPMLERHTRELKRVHNYIRNKRRKNEMEICILKLFPKFYEQAGEAKQCMESVDCYALQQNCLAQGRICHGSYNYHNIIFLEKQIATTNFEHADFGVQITDLYDYLRKILEKNNWDIKQGMQLLDEYQKIRPLESEESKMLYLLLLYPEKFWKQINFYYNGKKSWMSLKNYDKLLKIEKQETERRNFLKEAKSLLF